jgi:hypothetical protein
MNEKRSAHQGLRDWPRVVALQVLLALLPRNLSERTPLTGAGSSSVKEGSDRQAVGRNLRCLTTGLRRFLVG